MVPEFRPLETYIKEAFKSFKWGLKIYFRRILARHPTYFLLLLLPLETRRLTSLSVCMYIKNYYKTPLRILQNFVYLCGGPIAIGREKSFWFSRDTVWQFFVLLLLLLLYRHFDKWQYHTYGVTGFSSRKTSFLAKYIFL